MVTSGRQTQLEGRPKRRLAVGLGAAAAAELVPVLVRVLVRVHDTVVQAGQDMQLGPALFNQQLRLAAEQRNDDTDVPAPVAAPRTRRYTQAAHRLRTGCAQAAHRLRTRLRTGCAYGPRTHAQTGRGGNGGAGDTHTTKQTATTTGSGCLMYIHKWCASTGSTAWGPAHTHRTNNKSTNPPTELHPGNEGSSVCTGSAQCRSPSPAPLTKPPTCPNGAAPEPLAVVAAGPQQRARGQLDGVAPQGVPVVTPDLLPQRPHAVNQAALTVYRGGVGWGWGGGEGRLVAGARRPLVQSREHTNFHA
jgi:hypothetical protein